MIRSLHLCIMMALMMLMAPSMRANNIEDICIIQRLHLSDGKKEITIGGVSKGEGAKFKASDIIKWESPGDWMEVKIRSSKRGSKDVELHADTFFKHKDVRNAFDYVRCSEAASKGVDDMRKLLNNTYYMINDTVIVASSLLLDPSHAYFLRPVRGGIVEIQCQNEEDAEGNPYLLITREDLEVSGVVIDGEPVRFTVIYAGDGEDKVLTSKFVICPIE